MSKLPSPRGTGTDAHDLEGERLRLLENATRHLGQVEIGIELVAHLDIEGVGQLGAEEQVVRPVPAR